MPEAEADAVDPMPLENAESICGNTILPENSAAVFKLGEKRNVSPLEELTRLRNGTQKHKWRENSNKEKAVQKFHARAPGGAMRGKSREGRPSGCKAGS